jgi:hypothetical protein
MVLAQEHVDALMSEYYLGDEYDDLRQNGELRKLITAFPEGYMEKPVGVPDVVAFVHMGEVDRLNGMLGFNFFILAKREEPLASLGNIPDCNKSLSLWKYVPLFSVVPIKEDTDIVNRFNLVLDWTGPFEVWDIFPRMEIIMPAKGGWMVRTDPNGIITNATLLTVPPKFNPVDLFNAVKGFPDAVKGEVFDKECNLGEPFALFAFDKGPDITLTEFEPYKLTNVVPIAWNTKHWVVPARLSKPRCIHIDKPTLESILKKVNPDTKNDSCVNIVELSETVKPIIVYSSLQLYQIAWRGFEPNITFFIDSAEMIKTLVNLLYIECDLQKGGRKRKSKKSMKTKRRTNRARKYTKKYRHRSLRR